MTEMESLDRVQCRECQAGNNDACAELLKRHPAVGILDKLLQFLHALRDVVRHTSPFFNSGLGSRILWLNDEINGLVFGEALDEFEVLMEKPGL